MENSKPAQTIQHPPVLFGIQTSQLMGQVVGCPNSWMVKNRVILINHQPCGPGPEFSSIPI